MSFDTHKPWQVITYNVTEKKVSEVARFETSSAGFGWMNFLQSEYTKLDAEFKIIKETEVWVNYNYKGKEYTVELRLT